MQTAMARQQEISGGERRRAVEPVRGTAFVLDDDCALEKKKHSLVRLKSVN